MRSAMYFVLVMGLPVVSARSVFAEPVQVRDHSDGSESSGGVTATDTETEPRVRDHRQPRWPWEGTRKPARVRDHRDAGREQGGVTVTDSGAGPRVRDHRRPVTVRDHR